MAAKNKPSKKALDWARRAAANGQEVRKTKNGHPYAIIRGGASRVGSK